MALRIRSARTTKDIDLTLPDGTRLPKKSERAAVRAMLQEAAAADLHDYFEFLVGEAREEFYAPADLPEPPALSLFAGGIIGQLDAKRLSAESRKMH